MKKKLQELEEEEGEGKAKAVDGAAAEAEDKVLQQLLADGGKDVDKGKKQKEEAKTK